MFFRLLVAACRWMDLAALRTTAKTVLSGFAAWVQSSANGTIRLIELTHQLADVFQADASRSSDDSVRYHDGIRRSVLADCCLLPPACPRPYILGHRPQHFSAKSHGRHAKHTHTYHPRHNHTRPPTPAWLAFPRTVRDHHANHTHHPRHNHIRLSIV